MKCLFGSGLVPVSALVLIAVGASCGGLRKDGASRNDAASDASAGDHPDVVAADGAAPQLDMVVPEADGGACVPGQSCVPADPCREGETVCGSGGTATCSATQQMKADGTECGQGSVCKAGACSACADGSECPLVGNPCRVGTTSCATGTAACVESDSQPDGTACGMGMVCQGGACSACTSGESCKPTNPCHKGALSCAGGVAQCMDSGTNLAAGTTCGKDVVCNATAACVSCVAGANCAITGNPCRTGMTVCNTGAAACLESGNAPNGTACGSGNVCSGGACVPCVAGTACTPANSCHQGKSVCAPAITCADSATAVANGTSCGTDKVCSAGTCVTCATGKSCPVTVACKVGTTSCTTGVSACLVSGNSANGSSCGTGKVCIEGTCIACTTGSDCTPANPCHKGTLACDTGSAVCTDTAVTLPDGTPTVCGANRVCRGGLCVACVADQPCQLANLCKLGKTSCATGTSVCVESGNKPAGTSCSTPGMTGLVCNSTGVCAACNEGGDCNPANTCHKGKLSCASGIPVCMDTAMSLADGQPCGPTSTSNLFCKGGSCVTCAPNVQCSTNPNSCKLGVTSCATGASVCLDGANKAPNSPCGSSATSACSAADSCDGAGFCNPRHAGSGTDCGTCKQCDGAGMCVNGYVNMSDASGCSTAATACSGADTCDASGTCQANDLSGPRAGCNGQCQTCGGGSCTTVGAGVTDPSGACVPTTAAPCRTGKCAAGGACEETASVTCWIDGDGDKVGSGAAVTKCGGSCPAGFATKSGDCNDNNGNVFPGQTKLFPIGIDGTTTNKADANWDYDCDSTITMDPAFACGGCMFGAATGCTGAGITCGTQVVPTSDTCAQQGVLGADGVGRTACR